MVRRVRILQYTLRSLLICLTICLLPLGVWAVWNAARAENTRYIKDLQREGEKYGIKNWHRESTRFDPIGPNGLWPNYHEVPDWVRRCFYWEHHNYIELAGDEVSDVSLQMVSKLRIHKLAITGGSVSAKGLSRLPPTLYSLEVQHQKWSVLHFRTLRTLPFLDCLFMYYMTVDGDSVAEIELLEKKLAHLTNVGLRVEEKDSPPNGAPTKFDDQRR